MWEINENGTLAKNKELNSTLRCAYGTDGLVRVKVNNKTIGTFNTMMGAKNFLAETLKKWNEEKRDV